MAKSLLRAQIARTHSEIRTSQKSFQPNPTAKRPRRLCVHLHITSSLGRNYQISAPRACFAAFVKNQPKSGVLLLNSGGVPGRNALPVVSTSHQVNGEFATHGSTIPILQASHLCIRPWREARLTNGSPRPASSGRNFLAGSRAACSTESLCKCH